VYPTTLASLILNINDGPTYFIGTTACKYDGGTLDLTSSVPAVGRRRVLIAMDENGPYKVDGVAGGSYSDIPEPTDLTHFRLAFVYLKAGDTAITDWPDDVMIEDLRFSASRSVAAAGGAGLGDAIIVAKSGGNYANIQNAIDAASAEEHIVVLNGSWVENVEFSKGYLTMSTLKDAHHSGPYGTYIVGSDDVGPLFEVLGGSILQGFVLNRELSGGAGTYYGLDTSGWNVQLQGIRSAIGGGATGRDVVACRMNSTGQIDTNATLCVFTTDGGGATGAALVLSGTGIASIWQSMIVDDDLSSRAVLVDGAGTFKLFNCWIYGDINITAAATVNLINCYITGDVVVTGSVAATVNLHNCRVTGDVTGDGTAALELLATRVDGSTTGWASQAQTIAGSIATEGYNIVVNNDAVVCHNDAVVWV
jgi:hypothetical protein